MTPLRQRMIDEMAVRGFSPRTQVAYLAAVRDLARHYGCSPDRLRIEQLQSYLLHCLRQRQLSHSSCLQILNGLRFFYLKTLRWTSADLELPRPKQPQVLPEILSRAELERLFEAVANVKHQALLKTTYAAGLRVSEVVRLCVRDLDGERMTIRIEQAKGAKDRYSLLTPALRESINPFLLGGAGCVLHREANVRFRTAAGVSATVSSRLAFFPQGRCLTATATCVLLRKALRR